MDLSIAAQLYTCTSCTRIMLFGALCFAIGLRIEPPRRRREKREETAGATRQMALADTQKTAGRQCRVASHMCNVLRFPRTFFFFFSLVSRPLVIYVSAVCRPTATIYPPCVPHAPTNTTTTHLPRPLIPLLLNRNGKETVLYRPVWTEVEPCTILERK